MLQPSNQVGECSDITDNVIITEQAGEEEEEEGRGRGGAEVVEDMYTQKEIRYSFLPTQTCSGSS